MTLNIPTRAFFAAFVFFATSVCLFGQQPPAADQALKTLESTADSTLKANGIDADSLKAVVDTLGVLKQQNDSLLLREIPSETFYIIPGWRPTREEKDSLERARKEEDQKRQEQEEKDKKKDKKAIADSTVITYGLRIGVDLVQTLSPLIDSTYSSSWQIMLDYRIRPRIYASLDFGAATRKMDFMGENAHVNGYYAKIGALYGLNRGWIKRNDLMFVGVKFGYALYDQTISNIRLNNSYWGENPPSVIETKNLSTLWLDLSAGIKVQMIKNFQMGFSGSISMMLAGGKVGEVPPLVVPGMGQVYNTSMAFSFTYSLMYMIPIRRVSYGEVKFKAKEKRTPTIEQKVNEDGRQTILIKDGEDVISPAKPQTPSVPVEEIPADEPQTENSIPIPPSTITPQSEPVI